MRYNADIVRQLLREEGRILLARVSKNSILVQIFCGFWATGRRSVPAFFWYTTSYSYAYYYSYAFGRAVFENFQSGLPWVKRKITVKNDHLCAFFTPKKKSPFFRDVIREIQHFNFYQATQRLPINVGPG
jgi:hypothetical protein